MVNIIHDDYTSYGTFKFCIQERETWKIHLSDNQHKILMQSMSLLSYSTFISFILFMSIRTWKKFNKIDSQTWKFRVQFENVTNFLNLSKFLKTATSGNGLKDQKNFALTNLLQKFLLQCFEIVVMSSSLITWRRENCN